MRLGYHKLIQRKAKSFKCCYCKAGTCQYCVSLQCECTCNAPPKDLNEKPESGFGAPYLSKLSHIRELRIK